MKDSTKQNTIVNNIKILNEYLYQNRKYMHKRSKPRKYKEIKKDISILKASVNFLLRIILIIILKRISLEIKTLNFNLIQA